MIVYATDCSQFLPLRFQHSSGEDMASRVDVTSWHGGARAAGASGDIGVSGVCNPLLAYCLNRNKKTIKHEPKCLISWRFYAQTVYSEQPIMTSITFFYLPWPLSPSLAPSTPVRAVLAATLLSKGVSSSTFFFFLLFMMAGQAERGRPGAGSI